MIFFNQNNRWFHLDSRRLEYRMYSHRFHRRTMGQNRTKHRINSHSIIHFPTSEGVSEVSGASERANGRASGPILQSVFLVILAHSETRFIHVATLSALSVMGSSLNVYSLAQITSCFEHWFLVHFPVSWNNALKLFNSFLSLWLVAPIV